MISANLKTVIIEIGIKYTAKKVYNLTHFCICSSHDLFYGVYSRMETLHGHVTNEVFPFCCKHH